MNEGMSDCVPFFPVRIRLTWIEMLVASHVGSMRNVQSLKQNWTPGANVGLDNTWSPNIEGAAGEMAVAKVLGVYWDPVVGNSAADDVGPYQVRTNTSRKLEDMILRPRDREDRLYISVLSFAPEFVLCGWILGSQGKQQQWFRDGTAGRPPCYFVPRSSLNKSALPVAQRMGLKQISEKQA